MRLKLITVILVILGGAFVLGLLLPALSSDGVSARRLLCMNYTRQIGLSLKQYEQDKHQSPQTMDDLEKAGYLPPKVFQCPCRKNGGYLLNASFSTQGLQLTNSILIVDDSPHADGGVSAFYAGGQAAHIKTNSVEYQDFIQKASKTSSKNDQQKN
jgi:hypothetical protein